MCTEAFNGFVSPGIVLSLMLLLGTNLVKSPANAEVIETFDFLSTTYYFVTETALNHQRGEEVCKQRFNGTLAIIDNPLVLTYIDVKMADYRHHFVQTTTEIWLGGRSSAPQHQKVNPSEISNTGLCLVLSDWRDVESETTFNIYSKPCLGTTLERYLLCASTQPPVGKYIYAKSPCPASTKASEASFYISEAGCGTLKGTPLSEPSLEQLVLCQFDMCSTDSVEEISGGVVLSSGEHCPGQQAFPAYISGLYGAGCTKVGGRGGFLYELGHSVPRSQCIMQVCSQTKAPNYYSLVFSNEDACTLNERAGPVDIFTDSDRLCTSMKGKVITDAIQNAFNKTRCQMYLCHLSPGGCKTSETGREYNGDMSVTVSGKTCQRWDSQTPHPHSHTNPIWFPEASVAAASNYCRNPANWMEGPFCFTTDSNTIWEICNIPFCPGSGLQPIEYQDGLKHYIFVPGQHTDPTDFCQKAYDARPVLITGPLGKGVSQWLSHLITHSGVHQKEIWVGGRIPTLSQRGIQVTNYEEIITYGNTGSCLVLSNWNETLKAYSGDVIRVYTETCPTYYTKFLCEIQELKIENYQVNGGIPQMEVHDTEECRKSCQGACWAAGYNELEETCWHYVDTSDCEPGRATSRFTFFQKASCDCHQHLVSTDSRVVMNASSVAPSRGISLYSVDQGKLSARSMITASGHLLGAWVPAVSTLNEWIQAKFMQLRMIYGIVVLGMDGDDTRSFVREYQLKTSTMSNCESLVTYGGVTKFFEGNTQADVPATVILDQAVLVYCVRISPQAWTNSIALRFDVLGCLDITNVALRKRNFWSSDDDSGEAGSQVLVDGFTWGNCLRTPVLDKPWVMVDLGEYYDVDDIYIYTPKRCCDGQLKQLSVSVLSVWIVRPRTSSNEQCAFIPDAVPMGQPQKIVCSPAKTGRHIFIQKNMNAESLAICEVKAHGKKSKLQNVALNKYAQQSSLSYKGEASYAVDGNLHNHYEDKNKNKQCTHTTEERNPWWLVDLQEKLIITSVVIVGRADCCGLRIHDLFIYVGNSLEEGGTLTDQQLCASDEVAYTNDEHRHYSCQTPINGRYVKVILKTAKEYLTLCEVLVFGHPVMIPTYSGNGKDSTCSFPFTYNGNEYKTCITQDRDGRFWCSTTPNYDTDGLWGFCRDVKLIEGRVPSEGLVYVRANPEFTWGTVCDDGWDDWDATVVCKALGYSGGHAVYPPYFGAGTGNISIGDVQCGGDEESLLLCPHTKAPPHCGHHEDAAVTCANPGAVPLYGNPDIMRTQEDSVQQGIVIFPENEAMLMPGKLSSWRFYSLKKATLLALQIWRRVFDLKGVRFILVGSMNVTRALNTHKMVHIVNPVPVQIQTGDQIGFSFRGGNPIPYDHTFHCGSHGMIRFRTKASTDIGSIHSFPVKEDQNLGCRLYSLYAEVETIKMNVLKQFLYNGNLYRIFTSLLIKSSAETFCHSYMGQGSRVITVESGSEFQYLRSILSSMQLNGSFWINNSPRELSEFADWAPCQPEEGKECLKISNNNKGGRYLWYSDNCDVAMYFICEVKKPESSTPAVPISSNLPTSLPSKAVSEIQSQRIHIQQSTDKASSHLPLIITLSILLPAIVAALVVLLVLHIRKRYRSSANLTLFTGRHFLTESTCPLTPEDDNISVISQPRAGSVMMHRQNEDMAKPTEQTEIQSKQIGGIENPTYDKQSTDE